MCRQRYSYAQTTSSNESREIIFEREADMLGRKTVAIASGFSRREAMMGGTAVLVASPFVIHSGFAQRAAVNIGVIQPLSGALAQFGINSRNGIELVADEINAAGGIKALHGAKINLVVSDATSNPTTAPTAAQRLIAQNELTAVIGAFASSLTLVISELTARADIPFFTQAYADEITGRGLESVFKVTATASVIGRAQVNYSLAIAEAAGSKIDKIAIMYEDTAFGVAQSRGLRRAAKDANVEVVMDEPYPLGINDATRLIDKLRVSGAQAVFPLSYLNDSLFIVRAMRQERITVPVIGGSAGYVIPDFEKALGEFAEAVFSISPTNYDLAPALTDKFSKRFGYFMVHEAIEQAVALDVLVQAIERAKSAKPKAVTAALHSIRFDGGWTKAMPGGVVQFDQTGLNTLSVPIMVQWRNKELVTVWPKDFAKASPVWHSH
jgi:branched-chain amino acid transport system substrate-binding protein